MKIFKRILLGLFMVFILIQFIRPARNEGRQVLSTDITKSVNVPDKVLDVFKNSCYDCHSNTTRYPWYVNIQPMGWMMARHVNEGKLNLNFSDFGTYSKRKQANKLRVIAESINDGSMPISSYTVMHTDARLSAENIKMITNWTAIAKDSLDKNK